MAKKVARFKQRTREHVIADLSVHHVEGFVLLEGHTVQVVTRDYGYDLLVFTYGENGYIEPGFLFVQLKAAETLQRVGSDYVFDLDVRDYHLWMLEASPVILILYDASRRHAYWVHTQRYFRDDSRRPKSGAKTVRVRVPNRQKVTRKAISVLRELKRITPLRVVGGDE